MQELYENIKMAAYKLYEQRGMTHGCDLDDWLQAEKMVIEKNIIDIAVDVSKGEKQKTTNQRKKKIKQALILRKIMVD